MKKFLSLMIVLALAVASFASCGGDETDTTAADKPTVTTSATTNAPADTDADTTVADGTTADTTTADTTTADTTAGSTDAGTSENSESVDYNTENVLCAFDFRDEFEFDDNWNTGNGAIVFAETRNDVLYMEIDGGDSMMSRDSIDEAVVATDVKTIEIRVKNTSSDTRGHMYLATTVTDFSETATVTFDYANSGEDAEWEIVTINMADHAETLTGFTGDLTKIRFDPLRDGTEGTFYIDYIVLRG